MNALITRPVVIIAILASPIGGRAEAEEPTWATRGNVAVVCFAQVGDTAYAPVVEARIEKTLRDNGAKLLDRERADQLKQRWDGLGNPDYALVAEDFLKEASDFEFNVLVRAFLYSENHLVLGGFWSSTAQVSLKALDREANVLANGLSASLGTPEFPPSDGLTESAAAVNALQRASADACERLGLSILDPPVPTRLSFQVRAGADVSIGENAEALAVHPTRSLCYVGRRDGHIEAYSLDTDGWHAGRELSKRRIIWLGFSIDPQTLFAVDDKGTVFEIGDDLEWVNEVSTELGTTISAAVAGNARWVVLASTDKKLAVVSVPERRAVVSTLSGASDISRIGLGRDPRVVYVSTSKGCQEARVDEDLVLQPVREVLSTQTGDTWSGAEVDQQVLSPDGSMLAIAVRTRELDLLRNRATEHVEIRLLDLIRMTSFGTLRARSETSGSKQVKSLTFGPDWRFLAAGTGECLIRVWNTQTGQQEFEIPSGRSESARALASGAGGRKLVALVGDALRVWETSAH